MHEKYLFYSWKIPVRNNVWKILITLLKKYYWELSMKNILFFHTKNNNYDKIYMGNALLTYETNMWKIIYGNIYFTHKKSKRKYFWVIKLFVVMTFTLSSLDILLFIFYHHNLVTNVSFSFFSSFFIYLSLFYLWIY